jgi:phage shock protein A
MPYFSRTSEIIACDLRSMLQGVDNRLEVIDAIIQEVEQGVRSVRRASEAAELEVARLESDLARHRTQIEYWGEEAMRRVEAGQTDKAKLALLRKREYSDLTAGLEKLLESAIHTRDDMLPRLRAVEARLAEAIRMRDELTAGRGQPDVLLASNPPTEPSDPWQGLDRRKLDAVEEELLSLQKQFQSRVG